MDSSSQIECNFYPWKILRMLCIKEGDNNTKFFHKMANVRGRYNHLGILEVNGVLYEEESKEVSQIVQFYKKLYQETKVWRPMVEGLEFEQIGGWIGDDLKGCLIRRRSSMLLGICKGIKLQVQMASL